MNKYTARFKALCPNNKSIIDEYKCSIYTDKIIMVEDISMYLNPFINEAIYQEDLTERISKRFKAKVKITGWHLGIKIKSVSI